MLLVAWLTQQFFFDRWNGQINQLNSAEAVWDVYRSNHYIFNALRAEDDFGEAEPISHAAEWQLRNLDVGAGRLERVLPKEILAAARADVMDAQDGGFGGANGAMDIRFRTLQLALERDRAALISRKETTQAVFWCLYFLGAALALIGTLLREAIDSKQKAGTALTFRARMVQSHAWNGRGNAGFRRQ